MSRRCVGVNYTASLPAVREVHRIQSDQASLRWLLTIADPSGRLMRWRLRLSEFDFTVQYKRGSQNTQADALSRLTTLGETTSDIDDEIPCFTIGGDSIVHNYDHDFISPGYAGWDEVLATSDAEPSTDLLAPVSTEEFLRSQAEDRFCQEIRSRLNGGEVLPFADDERGYLVRIVEARPQIVVPFALKARILHLEHYPKLSSHSGGRKLYYSLRRDLYWPSMAVDCYATVRNCVTCAKNRVKLRKRAKFLRLFPAKAPLEFVSIDILGELIHTKKGNKFLLVIADRFSKLVRTVPMKRITAIEIAKAFVHHWVFVYGPPVTVLSDNGPQFAARLFIDIRRILGAKNVFTTTYHPQCNGQVERFNRTILNSLRHYVADHPRDWDLFTDALTYAYNTQVHSTTGVSPFELVLSRRPPTLSLQTEPDVGAEITARHYHTKWKCWLSALMSTAGQNMAKRQERYKRDMDKRTRPPAEVIKLGSHVFVRKEYVNPKIERKHKLSPVAEGPFPVKEVNNDTLVIERKDNTVERISRGSPVPSAHPGAQSRVFENRFPSQMLQAPGGL